VRPEGLCQLKNPVTPSGIEPADLNGMMRGIFGPRTEEVTEEWRKLHNEVLNVPYSPPNSIW
jgi:hypothetical protein